MIKVVITGSTGLVGSRIIELLQDKINFIHLLQTEIDITNKDDVAKFLESTDFDIFLHLAAYTNVDKAEEEKELAYEINVEGTKHISDIVSAKNKKLIYISTDFVFDGDNPPYYEDSLPNPKGYYGITKYEGENIIKNNSMIVRISYPYRASFEPKPDLVRKMRHLLEQKQEIKAITDSLITPTFIDDLAYSLKYLIENYSPQIFHIVGADSLSPFDAATLIAQTYNLDQSLIKPITFAEYSKDKAVRSQYSEIKSKKNNFYNMKTFQEGLLAIKATTSEVDEWTPRMV